MSDKREPRRLGYALVGAGAIAGVHAEALSQVPQAKLVAVYNRTAARARALGERWQIPWTTEYDRLLARPEVEVVSICTASGARLELARKAAQAGKHVVCEKPLEVTLERADQIIQACEQARVQLGVIFEYRFFPATLAVKKAVAAQRLGRMVLAAAHVPWYRTDAYYASGAWRATWALDGGGALMNQSIHWIDLLLWMGGDVSKVHGFTARRAHPQIEVEDVGVAVLQFQGGALGTIQGTTGAYPGLPARIELYGDRGTIVLQERQIVAWKLADCTPDEEARMLQIERGVTATGASDPSGIGAEGHRLQFADVTAAILAGRPPSIDGHEGRKALALIRAVYRSNTTKHTVIMPFRDA